MGMTNILLGLIAYAAVIVAVVLAYAAGRLDGRREGQRQTRPRTGSPIQMDHTHGGDADGGDDP